jgi:hypothetical protein
MFVTQSQQRNARFCTGGKQPSGVKAAEQTGLGTAAKSDRAQQLPCTGVPHGP